MINSARKDWIGVGVESAFATPAPQTDNIFWTTSTLEGVHKPIQNVAAYGRRDKVSSTVKGQQWGQGDVEFNLDPSLSGYFYAAALGTTARSTVSGSVQSHTHSQNQGNTPYSLSLYNDRVVDRQLYAGASVDKLQTKVQEGLATAKASVMSLFPTNTTSGSVTPAAGTVFTWANYTYQFGANFAGASAASASPLTEFDFTINNNTKPLYESGGNGTSRIAHGDFEIDGNFTQYFESTTDRDAFYNNTPRAMIIKFLGAGSGATQEKTQFNFYSVYLDTFAVETGIDNFFIEKSKFIADVSVSDNKTFDMVQVNSNSNY